MPCLVKYEYINIKQEGMGMCNDVSEKELIDTTIREYCDLLRIKKYQTTENPELNFQLKEKEIKLTTFGINTKELKFD